MLSFFMTMYVSIHTVTGKGLAHFFSIFFVTPLGEADQFGTGRFCELALLPMGGHEKIREKICTTFARHCSQ